MTDSPRTEPLGASGAPADVRELTLAGGCFWCLDAVYRRVRGVLAVESGYTGGDDPAPSYESVCTGTTGHAEAVRVRFDAAVVPPEVIMDLFFTGHDPTSLNRQGADVGNPVPLGRLRPRRGRGPVLRGRDRPGAGEL